MVQKKEIIRKRSEDQSQQDTNSRKLGPFVRYKIQYNPETNKNEVLSIELSDGTTLDGEESIKKFAKALEEAVGTNNLDVATQMLSIAAMGMTESNQESRFNNLLTVLPSFRPENETEATLFSQFVALQKSGFRCLRNANDSDNFFHIEKLFSLASKLLRTANETMQTILKCRTGGRQEIQIVHLYNEGQAIVTQTLSSGGGGKIKCETEPHG